MKVSLARLRTVTLAGLAERLISASKEGNYTISISEHPLLKALEEEYKQYKNLVAKQTFSGKGAEVARADKERDKLFVGLKNYLKGYLGLPQLPHQTEAQALYEAFKLNDLNLDKKSYTDQTVLLDKLIAALDAGTNKAGLKALNLESIFTELKQKQAAFVALMAEQTEANAELRLTKSASAVRKDLEQALRAYIDFVAVMKTQPEWTALYKELNEIVKSAKNS